MKFLVDECISLSVILWLKSNGYDIKIIKNIASGLDDDGVLELAHHEQRVLLTSDKDFGEITFFRKKNHSGIILLRLNSFSSSKNIEILKKILDNHHNEINGNFVVATASNIRVVKS